MRIVPLAGLIGASHGTASTELAELVETEPPVEAEDATESSDDDDDTEEAPESWSCRGWRWEGIDFWVKFLKWILFFFWDSRLGCGNGVFMLQLLL